MPTGNMDEAQYKELADLVNAINSLEEWYPERMVQMNLVSFKKAQRLKLETLGFQFIESTKSQKDMEIHTMSMPPGYTYVQGTGANERRCYIYNPQKLEIAQCFFKYTWYERFSYGNVYLSGPTQ
ncbi:uncharacterized protein LOC143034559 [Oratosquilla oratoria]|uniref:uncharacterized protein LOC143034559 n=1 Tax=Oratosquilla oratoria TaxID=337810 RepID=UPI003F75CCB0